LRWLKTSDASLTALTASETDSCINVNESGMYVVFSQITFRFNGYSTVTDVAHSVMTIRDGEPNTVQKKMVSVPVRRPDMEKDERTLMPSNLIVFVDVTAGDALCIRVYPITNIYASNVDNALTILKL